LGSRPINTTAEMSVPCKRGEPTLHVLALRSTRIPSHRLFSFAVAQELPYRQRREEQK